MRFPFLPSKRRIDDPLVPVAATDRGEWIIELVSQSKLPLPKVRKSALCESFRAAQSDERLIEIFMDAVCGSPYLPDALKERLVEAVMLSEWHKLPSLVGLGGRRRIIRVQEVIPRSKLCQSFKAMALGILKTSRKMKQLPVNSRRQLGNAILGCHTVEQVLARLLQSMQEFAANGRSVLDFETRTLIANDALEGNFHRLLLGDRFDCDEIRRQAERRERILATAPMEHEVLEQDQEEESVFVDDECIICFENRSIIGNVVLPCGHEFCRDCMTDWSQRNARGGGGRTPCPLCRRGFRPNDISYHS